jgi:hypothetical protein
MGKNNPCNGVQMRQKQEVAHWPALMDNDDSLVTTAPRGYLFFLRNDRGVVWRSLDLTRRHFRLSPTGQTQKRNLSTNLGRIQSICIVFTSHRLQPTNPYA